jgi:glycosyltransferase involved in cell wall biosynthesis
MRVAGSNSTILASSLEESREWVKRPHIGTFVAVCWLSMNGDRPSEPTLAILIPCLDEERGIAGVVTDYQREFPDARILVIDNGSSDATAERARAAGAEVLLESRRGKGRAIATAFDLLHEELVLMVDGDGTYPAEGARRLLEAHRKEAADMITGVRSPDGSPAAFRPLHRLGSAAFAWVFRLVFHYAPQDLFSGLRLFSNRFYKNVPLLFRGFELETELTVQAVEKGFRLTEVAVPFRERAEGSSSLRTVRDGPSLAPSFVLFRDYRPPFRWIRAVRRGQPPALPSTSTPDAWWAVPASPCWRPAREPSLFTLTAPC